MRKNNIVTYCAKLILCLCLSYSMTYSQTTLHADELFMLHHQQELDPLLTTYGIDEPDDAVRYLFAVALALHEQTGSERSKLEEDLALIATAYHTTQEKEHKAYTGTEIAVVATVTIPAATVKVILISAAVGVGVGAGIVGAAWLGSVLYNRWTAQPAAAQEAIQQAQAENIRLREQQQQQAQDLQQHNQQIQNLIQQQQELARQQQEQARQQQQRQQEHDRVQREQQERNRRQDEQIQNIAREQQQQAQRLQQEEQARQQREQQKRDRQQQKQQEQVQRQQEQQEKDRLRDEQIQNIAREQQQQAQRLQQEEQARLQREQQERERQEQEQVQRQQEQERQHREREQQNQQIQNLIQQQQQEQERQQREREQQNQQIQNIAREQQQQAQHQQQKEYEIKEIKERSRIMEKQQKNLERVNELRAPLPTTSNDNSIFSFVSGITDMMKPPFGNSNEDNFNLNKKIGNLKGGSQIKGSTNSSPSLPLAPNHQVNNKSNK